MIITQVMIVTFGLIFGSFFNVVGMRLPSKVGFVNSRSSCPNCKKILGVKDLIPVISFIVLNGKCSNCGQRISFIYPVIELSTAILFLLSYNCFENSSDFLGAILLSSLGIILTVSDIKYMLIPNSLLLFFVTIFIVYRTIYPLDQWYASLLGAAVGFFLVMLIILVSRGGMGAGDMKLLGVLGILLGVKLTLLTFFLATLIGTIVSLLLLAFKVIKRKEPFPFGPSIAAAAFISYLYGNEMITFYIENFLQ